MKCVSPELLFLARHDRCEPLFRDMTKAIRWAIDHRRPMARWHVGEAKIFYGPYKGPIKEATPLPYSKTVVTHHGDHVILAEKSTYYTCFHVFVRPFKQETP